MTDHALVLWNMMLSAVAFPALGFFIKKLINDSREDVRERCTRIELTISELKCNVRDLQHEITTRVKEADCKEYMAAERDLFKGHSHNKKGRVIIS